jgi:ankyrin repeat protein
MYAAIGQPRIAEFLISSGVSVHAVDGEGCIALHYAAVSGQCDSLGVLIAAGADVLHCDRTGGTALHAALRCSRLAAVKVLLEHGADTVVNAVQCKKWSDYCQVTALMMCDDTAILKLLLTAGADVRAVTSNGDTCLHIAACHGCSAPVVCLLIKAGADMSAVNNRGETAAVVAHDSGNTLIEQLLIRAAQQALVI